MNRCKAEKQKHSLPIGCCVAILTLSDSHYCGETHYRCIIQSVLTNSLHVPVDVRQSIQTESIFRKCEWARKSRGRGTWQTESIHAFLTSLLGWTQQDDLKCCSWDIKAVALKLLYKPLWVAVISLSERRPEDRTNVFHYPGLTRPELPGLFRESPHKDTITVFKSGEESVLKEMVHSWSWAGCSAINTVCTSEHQTF